MKYTYTILGIIAGILFSAGLTVYAVSASPTSFGGTGTTTPSGILYGDNGASQNLNTVKIGSGCTFSGGTLSCPGAAATVVGTISTSTPNTINQILYFTNTGGYPANVSGVATTSIGADGTSLSFSGTAGAQIGGANGTYSINTGNTNTWSVLQNFNYSSSTLYSSFKTASTTNLIIAGESFNHLTGTGLTDTAGTLTVSAVPNSALSNSTISGVALGGTLAGLSATNASLTFSGTYTGTAAQTVGLNLANSNTWSVNQNFNYSSSTAYSSFVTASTTNLIVNGQSFKNLLGTGLSNSSGVLTVSAVPNASLSNSTISGIALGSNLASHSTNASLSGTSYNGSATVSDWGLNLANTNTWSVLQNFNYSSSTAYATFNVASSTNLFAGNFTLATSTAGCLNVSGGGVVFSKTCGSGTVTSITLGDNLFGTTPLTTTGTIYGAVGTSTTPTLGQVAYWSGVGDATHGAKLNSVATSTPTVTSPITYSGTLGSFIGGVAGTFGCATCNTSNASVSSVGLSSTNSTLTIGATPITTSGTITADLNLGHTNTWTILQNFGAASTTQLTASSYLSIPSSSTASSTYAGQVAIDTSANEFHYFGSSEEVIYPKKTPGFVYATTTAWSATTTVPLPSSFTAQTINAVQCYTDAGTLNVDVYHTTTHLTLLNASTTQGIFTYGANNTMSTSEKWFADVGTPATSPTKISCTFKLSVIGN